MQLPAMLRKPMAHMLSIALPMALLLLILYFMIPQLRIFVLLESLSLVLATQEFTVGFGYPSGSGMPNW